MRAWWGFVVVCGLLGCNDDLPQFGAGHYCQRDDHCVSPLICVARECAMPPERRGTPLPMHDAGPDAGPGDAGPPDAGTTDAGTTDAGTMDAGEMDAGEMDAGEMDAGEMDAGADGG